MLQLTFDSLCLDLLNIASLYTVWLRVKLTASNNQNITLSYDALDGTDYPGSSVVLPTTYPNRALEELLGDKTTARDNDTKALNVYLKAIYYLAQSFVCLRIETLGDLSSDVIQFGAGWKYPFWRF